MFKGTLVFENCIGLSCSPPTKEKTPGVARYIPITSGAKDLRHNNMLREVPQLDTFTRKALFHPQCRRINKIQYMSNSL